jgi:hypothetical protein
VITTQGSNATAQNSEELRNLTNEPGHISKPVTADAPGQLEVLGHDGDSSGVDGAEVGVLEQGDEVSLSSLLKGQDGRALESQFLLEFVGKFAD